MAISTIRLQSLKSDSNLHKKTAISTIWQQFLQSDCNLHNRTAIYTIRLQFRRIADWLLRLQSDCWECKSFSTYLYMPQPSTRCQAANPIIELQSKQSDCNAGGLQSDCWDCSLIAEIAKFGDLHIRLVILPRVGEVAWYRIAVLFSNSNQSM